MINKAFLRANIPFTFNNTAVFDTQFEQNAQSLGWTKQKICGDLLLKHINTCLKENVVCFSKHFDALNLTAKISDFQNLGQPKECALSVTEISVFYFDTKNGIISLHIPFSNDITEDDLVNLCSILRCSVRHTNTSSGLSLICGGKETYLSDIAQLHTQELIGGDVNLFNHLNDESLRRIDIFSCVLCQKNDKKPLDILSYRLANALDNRDKNLEVEEKQFYRPQENFRWCFSKRGASVVASLCDVESTNNFLNGRWFDTIQSNYYYLYILVLHQKYAIYNYLDNVATDTDKTFIKSNQESLIDFNSKYIFSIISDETMLQKVYLGMKQVNNVDEVYGDLLDELKRMFDYSQLKKDEANENRNSKFNFISLIISLLCGSSIIIETFNVFSSHGFGFGFSTLKNSVCTISVISEALLLTTFLIIAFAVNKKKK